MANKVKITGSGKVLCGGYPGEGIYTEPANINTETTNTSGSQAFTFVFHNICTTSGSDNNSQQVRVNAHYNWSVSYDEYANMSVTLHGYIDSVTAVKRGSGPGSCNALFFLKAGFNADNLLYSITYQVKTYATLGGAGDLGEKKFTIPSGSSQTVPTMYIFNGLNGHQNAWCDGYVDRMEGGLTFSNPNAIIRVAPTITPDCTSDSPVRAILKATIDYKNGDGSNKYTYCVSRDTNFTSCVKSGEGVGTPSVSVTALQPNTKYYVKWTANNGYKSSEATCSFVTYASNSITSIVTPDYKTADIYLAVQNGGQEYAPSTQLQYKKCDATNWTNGGTTDAVAYATLALTTLDAETCYQARALTTTTAGTYLGVPVEFQTPAKNLAVANYTKIETSVDDTSYDVCANLCYKWETGSVPAKITLYYRVKDGYDTRWYKIDAPDATTATGTNCVQVCGLYPNQTVYETYIHTETVDGEYDSDLSEFTTPVLPEPDIHNCETFGYLTELLCQSIVKLYDGMKTIYANDCTKEACDPDSLNPTQAALWSRALRYLHALSCLLCDMAGASFTNSKDGQYLVGEAGWQDILKTIDESDTENGWKLATSDAVKRYILDKLHNIWHFHDAVDYLVATNADLNNLPGNASSAIVASENKVYRKQGSSWVMSTALEDKVDPMGVWHINQASTTTGGGVTYKVQAGSAWYFWNGKWQPMDASIDDLDKIVDELWGKRNLIVTYENGQPRLHINTVDRLQYNCANQPAGERWVTFITEPLSVPPPGYYEVSFITGTNATIIQPQQVLAGALAQRPVDPTRIGYVFNGWVNNATGSTYNWSAAVNSNLVLRALWNPQPITITFDLNGGSGTTPAPMGLHYGDTITTLPTDANFSRTGYQFLGWTRDGVFVTPTTPMVGNTTLKAAWEANVYTITFDGQNDDTPLAQQGDYATQMPRPADPVKEDSIFMGWFTQPTGGTAVNFPITVTQNITYYAQYVPATYTVNFDSNGGTPVDSQTIPYQGSVEKPQDPILSGRVFSAWYLNGTVYSFGQQVTSSFTLVAEWLTVFNVIFNLNGGTGNAPTQTVVENDYAQEPDTPTRDGFTFLGWFKPGEESPFGFDSTLITANLLLEAHWEAEPVEELEEGD